MRIDIRKVRESMGLRGDGSFEEVEKPIPRREAPPRRDAPPRRAEQPRLRDVFLEVVLEQMRQRLEAANAAAQAPRAGAGRETRRPGAGASRRTEGARGSSDVRRAEWFGGRVEFEERVDADSVSSGVRVKHATFGVGVVRTVNRGGSRTNVTVEFDGAGMKRLLLELAPMRILRRGER